MHGHNAAGICFDPGNRIRSSLDTRADVELQHHVLARVRGEHFHGALTLDGDELGFVIVVARAKTQRLELFGGAAQDVRYTLPAIEAVDSSRAGHDDELAPDDLVDLDGVWKVLGGECAVAVVGREAADADVVHELFHILGVGGRPVEIGSVELDAFVAHFGDAADRAHQVLFQLFPHRKQLESDRNMFALCHCRGERGSRGQSEERTAGEGVVRHHRSR